MDGLDRDPRSIVYIALAAALFVKFCGYLLAAKSLDKAFPSSGSGIFGPALVRTLIGAIGGRLYLEVWSHIGVLGGGLGFLLLFYLGMTAFRLAQWWSVLYMFYPGAVREPKRGWFCAIVGTLWSHFLDVPAWIAFVFAMDKQLDSSFSFGL